MCTVVTPTTAIPTQPSHSPTEEAAAELPRAYYEKIAATHDSIDKVQQSITVALQQIDKNFSDCYKCALSLYQELAQYHALQLETRKALEVICGGLSPRHGVPCLLLPHPMQRPFQHLIR